LHSLLLDFGSYARYVVAVPLCLVAESVCPPHFGRIILHFRNNGFVSTAERGRYEAIIASSIRLLESTAVEIIAFVIAYGVAVAFIFNAPASDLPEWHFSPGPSEHTLSAAGRWHAMVSLPLLVVLLLGWAWRHLLWTRFLWFLARLDLQIIPAHPDRCCGLRFLSTSIRGYGPLGFACSSIVAGGIANKVLQGASTEHYYHMMLIVVVALVLLFVAPLTIFMPLLRRAQIRAIFEYGALAKNIGGDLERKWIPRRHHTDPDDLTVPDFSATTDLYSIVGNVYSVGYLPLSLKTLQEILILVALPFVPVILMAVPLSQIFKNLMNLLI